MDLQNKYDGINLAIFKDIEYDGVIYNGMGDHFKIHDYDIRFFKKGQRSYFFTINTYPNPPKDVLKYLSFPQNW